MRKLRLPTRQYNTTLLHQTLRDVLGDVFKGISGVPDNSGGWLEDTYDADLADNAPRAIEPHIIATALAHDTSMRTPEQEKEAEVEAARAKAEQGKIDAADPKGAATVEELAVKVAGLQAQVEYLMKLVANNTA